MRNPPEDGLDISVGLTISVPEARTLIKALDAGDAMAMGSLLAALRQVIADGLREHYRLS